MTHWFQAQVRMPESRAAFTVFEKYKRGLGLGHGELLEMQRHVMEFSEARSSAGKSAHRDLLTQEASRYCKTKWGKK